MEIYNFLSKKTFFSFSKNIKSNLKYSLSDEDLSFKYNIKEISIENINNEKYIKKYEVFLNFPFKKEEELKNNYKTCLVNNKIDEKTFIPINNNNNKKDNMFDDCKPTINNNMNKPICESNLSSSTNILFKNTPFSFNSNINFETQISNSINNNSLFTAGTSFPSFNSNKNKFSENIKQFKESNTKIGNSFFSNQINNQTKEDENNSNNNEDSDNENIDTEIGVNPSESMINDSYFNKIDENKSELFYRLSLNNLIIYDRNHNKKALGKGKLSFEKIDLQKIIVFRNVIGNILFKGKLMSKASIKIQEANLKEEIIIDFFGVIDITSLNLSNNDKLLLKNMRFKIENSEKNNLLTEFDDFKE